MPTIEILGTGRIDDRESAFPQAVQLPGGDVLCSFNVGGGALVTGGTEWARSRDGGETWSLEGSVLAPTEGPRTTNALKLSLSADGNTVYAYGWRGYPEPGQTFGHVRHEPILCKLEGDIWSEPATLPMPVDCPLEISHGVLPLASGRLLAPAATLPSQDRLGEQVFVAVSDDNGSTWPRHAVVFQDPDERVGFFEQKLAEVGPDVVMATCWTVTFGDVVDQPDSFTLSHDGGLTWSPAKSTGILGQTLTPIPLGGDRLLVLYNRRYGDQGIVMALVTFSEDAWQVHYEGIMYDASSRRSRPDDIQSGVEELDGFQFGFPTALRLHDGTFLATHWSHESGRCGIRWTKLRIHW